MLHVGASTFIASDGDGDGDGDINDTAQGARTDMKL
jgi:hypothetical protein